MREILFRGKQISDGEWVEGYLGIEVNNSPVIQWCEFDENYGVDCVEESAVIPETVGQYTGLTDKNGTRIFEGDIVAVYDAYCNETVVGIVCFGDGSFYIRDTDCSSYDRWMYYESEVIGNIHDNPELLKNN